MDVKMGSKIIEKVVEQLRTMPPELQWRVLEFTRALSISTPRGVPGKDLLRFSGMISITDLEQMREAIDQGCEKIDTNEW